MAQDQNNTAPIRNIQELRDRALEQLESLAATQEAARDKCTWKFKELWKDKDKPQEFLIPELIPSSSVIMLLGEDGIGKTQLMSQLALEVGMNHKTFLGMKLNVKHRHSVVIATEDSKEKFTSAVVKIAVALEPQIKPDDVNLDFIEGSVFDDLIKLVAEINTVLTAEPADVVITDAFSDLFTLIDGEINSNTHARRLLSVLQTIAYNHKTALIVIHHAAKSKMVAKRKEGKLFVVKEDSQGAGAITQKPRTVLALTHDPTSVREGDQVYKNYFHVVKANLMGKTYQIQAVECEFSLQTLMHRATGLVDIQMMQSKLDDETKAEQPNNNRKAVPREISDAEHKQNCLAIFSSSGLMARVELVDKIRTYYNVGQVKVEAKDGLLNYLVDKGFVEKDKGFFRLSAAIQKEAGMATGPPKTNGWQPAVDEEEDAPF